MALGTLFASNRLLAQNFINLNFQQAHLTNLVDHGYGFKSGTANIPGWTEYNGWGDANYAGGMSLIFNNQTLDAPMVGLMDTNYWSPYGAIQGYSILMFGGSFFYGHLNEGPTGASISQFGQIPSNSRSMTLWQALGNVQASFNGEPLFLTDIADTPNYSIYQADISAYAGQSGLLTFSVPWQGGAVLDNIQFSTSPAPEPNASFILSCGLTACWLLKRNQKLFL